MKESELAVQTAAADAYQDFFVPALFLEWGPRMVEAAAVRSGDRVLDVACGTGVLTRAAAETAGPVGAVTGLDRNPGMLAVARRLSPAIAWREGSAESLPFADQSFDVVLCQFGLMFFGDRIGALREMWRVLKPGGRLAVAVWASLDDTPAYAAEVALIEARAGAAAAEAMRAPFVLGDTERFASLFHGAGIPVAAISTVTGSAVFPSIRAMVETDLRGWLQLMGVPLSEAVIVAILEEAETVLAPYRSADGTVRFDSPAHIAHALKAA